MEIEFEPKTGGYATFKYKLEKRNIILVYNLTTVIVWTIFKS